VGAVAERQRHVLGRGGSNDHLTSGCGIRVRVAVGQVRLQVIWARALLAWR